MESMDPAIQLSKAEFALYMLAEQWAGSSDDEAALEAWDAAEFRLRVAQKLVAICATEPEEVFLAYARHLASGPLYQLARKPELRKHAFTLLKGLAMHVESVIKHLEAEVPCRRPLS